MQSAMGCARKDKLALRSRVGDTGDAGVGIVLGYPERKRAPTAAEFENGLAVNELGAFASEPQHGLFSFTERMAVFIKISRTVFQARAQNFFEEGGGDFVVLGVSGIGAQGDGTLFHRFDEGQELRAVGRFGVAVLFAESITEHSANRKTNQ